MSQTGRSRSSTSYNAQAYLQLVPGFIAQLAGALFGTVKGFQILLGSLLNDAKRITSPEGRKEIIYGRKSSAEPVTFETSKTVEDVKSRIAGATNSAKAKVSSTFSNPPEPVTKATASIQESVYQSKQKLPEIAQGAKVKAQNLPALTTPSAAKPATASAPLGPGTVNSKAAKPSTDEKLVPGQLDRELNAAPTQPVTKAHKTTTTANTYKSNGVPYYR